MAKQIKVIKCPQCGSTNNIKLAEDRYKCNNCDAEYFLDNDDVNVNVNYSYKDNKPSVDTSRILKWVIIGVFSFIILIFLITTCVSLFSSKSSDSGSYNTYSSPSTNFIKEEKIKDEISYSDLFLNSKQEPIILEIVKRKDKDSKLEYYAKFVGIDSDKAIGITKLEISKLDDYEIRTFSNGDIYITINKKLLYRVNLKDMTVDNVSESMFSRQTLLSAGLASIEFVRESWGDGFNVVTNLGKEYYFYPIVDKVYTKDSFFDAVFGFNNLLPGAKNVTYYEMSSRSREFEDEPIQLLQIVYKYNSGGPEEKATSPSWFKDFGGSGIFTERSPYTKRLFSNIRNRIVSYKDLTPGRNYFAASVVYFDDKNVIISFRPTVAEDAPRILQCLSMPSFDVAWSLDLEFDSKYDYIHEMAKIKDGYAAKIDNRKYLLLTNDGKLEKKIEL